MKPFTHAKVSARRYGGHWSDYLQIHEWFDQTKAGHADMRHRAILHNSMGIYIATQVFGQVMANSDGTEFDVRQVCEDHVMEDLGRIPSISEICGMIPEEQISRLAFSRQHPIRRAD